MPHRLPGMGVRMREVLRILYADTEGVTEAVKADDPMAWVRKMNGIRHRANEAVMQEIVYG